MATTVRNLRVREHKAKCLLNLDVNSAFYDPKSRSMRDNPLPGVDPDKLVYRGDNFVRDSGDAVELARTQVFAWAAGQRGQEVHMQGAPSQAELARKNFEKERERAKQSARRSIEEKYGVAEGVTMGKLDERLALGQTERMAEYARDGRVKEARKPRQGPSRYEEDVFPGNHSSVFGSFFDTKTMKWGFQCCRATERNSYCTGAKGREAAAQP